MSDLDELDDTFKTTDAMKRSKRSDGQVRRRARERGQNYMSRAAFFSNENRPKPSLPRLKFLEKTD